MSRRKRFTSERSANSFAEKVNGKVNDLRNIPEAKSNFTVTYEPDPSRAREANDWPDWSPEEDRDFGYPNEYWD